MIDAAQPHCSPGQQPNPIAARAKGPTPVQPEPTARPHSSPGQQPNPIAARANGPTHFQPGPTAQVHGVASKGGLKARFIPRRANSPTPVQPGPTARPHSSPRNGPTPLQPGPTAQPHSTPGQLPNPFPAWANGPGSWGSIKGRAEGPVHSASVAPSLLCLAAGDFLGRCPGL